MPFDKEKDAYERVLKLTNVCSILLSFGIWFLFYFHYFEAGFYNDGVLNKLIYPGAVVFPLFTIFALVIVLRSNKGALSFALFLSLMSQNVALQCLAKLAIYNVSFLGLATIASTAVTGTVFMKSFQVFPRHLTVEDASVVFPKFKLVSTYLSWSFKRFTWMFFLGVILFGGLLTYQTSFEKWVDIFLNLMIMITGILSLFVNYKRSTPSEKNKILWLLWGIIIYFLSFVIATIVYAFNPGQISSVTFVLRCISNACLMASMVMSVFFFDTFNTGVIVRRTLVDGTIFVLFVLVYNTIEHYFLHWLSHELHLSDALVSSFLSGIFVLVFSPLHHKLMFFAEKKLKRNGGV